MPKRIECRTAIEEAFALASEVAWPGGCRPGVKEAIRTVQRITGSTHRRARALLYREARRVDPEELDRLRAGAARKARGNDAADEQKNGSLHARIAALEADLASLKREILDRGRQPSRGP